MFRIFLDGAGLSQQTPEGLGPFRRAGLSFGIVFARSRGLRGPPEAENDRKLLGGGDGDDGDDDDGRGDGDGVGDSDEDDGDGHNKNRRTYEIENAVDVTMTTFAGAPARGKRPGRRARVRIAGPAVGGRRSPT